MITVHHLENSRSHRVLWLLEELELDYEVDRYERDPETMRAPDELRQIHPLGKSPAITDDDYTVAESAVILEHVLDEYGDGALRPDEGTDAYQKYRYWMHYAEGSAMPPLLMKFVFNELPEQSPWFLSPLLRKIADMVGQEFLDPEIERHVEFWEAELADREYFVGDTFTAADIQMSFPLAGVVDRAEGTEAYPNCRDLIGRLRDRPAFRRALERSGDDSPLP